MCVRYSMGREHCSAAPFWNQLRLYCPKQKPRRRRGLSISRRNLGLRGFMGLYQYVTATGTLVHEFNGTGDLGEERVIFAASDICAGLDAGTALANDDCAAGNKLAAEGFYA